MKNSFNIFLCCLIFNCCDKAKKSNSIVINNDIRELSKKDYDTITRNKFLKLAAKYAYNRRFYEINKIIINKSESIKDTIGIIYAKSNIGLYYLNKFSNDSSYYYFSKAEKLSQKLKGNPHLSKILQSKADLRWCQKDFSGAESTAINALKIATAKNNNINIFSCYITLANSLAGMNKDEEALDYYNKALLILEQLKNLPQFAILKAQTQNYIAKIYQRQNQHQKVISYLKDNINFKEIKKADLQVYSYITNAIAYSKFKLNDKSALPLFQEVLYIADSTKFTPTQVAVKINLSEYYLAQKDTATAFLYAKGAQKIAHQNKIFEDELKTFQLLASIIPDDQSFYNQRYIKLNDSLQNIERATRDKFARIEFETEEVTKQKNKVEEEKSVLLNRLFLISGFGLLTIIIILLWFNNKSQHARTRELLLEQENLKDKEEIYQLMINQHQKIIEGKQLEKKRISQELHDGIMGKLTAIRMNLYALNRSTDPETIEKCIEHIKEIQNIENEIRIISHDLNKNLFSDNVNFVSIVENLFTAIKSHNDIAFSLKVDESIDWETVDNTIKINIYRIIQEALQNIDKYAQPEHVAITMDKKGKTIVIEIKDDGIGFTIKRKRNGIGISNMQDRMKEIKGKFKIESQPKMGTKINLIIPN